MRAEGREYGSLTLPPPCCQGTCAEASALNVRIPLRSLRDAAGWRPARLAAPPFREAAAQGRASRGGASRRRRRGRAGPGQPPPPSPIGLGPAQAARGWRPAGTARCAPWRWARPGSRCRGCTTSTCWSPRSTCWNLGSAPSSVSFCRRRVACWAGSSGTGWAVNGVLGL